MTATLRRMKRFLKAQGTLLHWLGWGVRPYGFYTPYRHAGSARPLGPDECVEWLKSSFDRQAEEFADLVGYARRFNDDFRAFRSEDPRDGNRPRFDQDWFPGIDGAVAYALVRRTKPRRIIEVGSGHSTRFLAAAVRDEGIDCSLHSVDPEPRRDIDALCATVTRATVGEMDKERFLELEERDILFVDSSHVAMPGTDVHYLFTEILPLLKKGVLVHFHDIFLPHGYPAEWAWRGYNEQDFLLTLLGGGTRYQVLMANAYMRRHHPEALKGLFAPLAEGAREAGFWLRVC